MASETEARPAHISSFALRGSSSRSGPACSVDVGISSVAEPRYAF